MPKLRLILSLMKKNILRFAFAIMVLFCFTTINAQIPVKINSGMIYISDGSFKPDPKKYAAIADSLDKRLKTMIKIPRTCSPGRCFI